MTHTICTNCVMDTTDTKITFDKDGVCDHCTTFYRDVRPNWHTDEYGRKQLGGKVKKFKEYPTFTPNLTPRDIFKLGSFGGTYWRPIYSKITRKHYWNNFNVNYGISCINHVWFS